MSSSDILQQKRKLSQYIQQGCNLLYPYYNYRRIVELANRSVEFLKSNLTEATLTKCLGITHDKYVNETSLQLLNKVHKVISEIVLEKLNFVWKLQIEQYIINDKQPFQSERLKVFNADWIGISFNAAVSLRRGKSCWNLFSLNIESPFKMSCYHGNIDFLEGKISIAYNDKVTIELLSDTKKILIVGSLAHVRRQHNSVFWDALCIEIGNDGLKTGITMLKRIEIEEHYMPRGIYSIEQIPKNAFDLSVLESLVHFKLYGIEFF
ncbi:MAG: hypothetical protein M3Q95_08025 [Bacteroidota bacterium]|nr:hypothetical protein [Bacteroidota bacterium]